MKNLYIQLINAIKFKESATVLGFKDDGLYEMVSKLERNSDIAQILQNSVEDEIILKNLSIRLLQDLITSGEHKEIARFLGLSQDRNYFSPSEIEEGKRVVFILEEIDRLQKPDEIIGILDQARKLYRGKVSFIYLVEDVEIFLGLQKNLEQNSSFFDNTIIQPLEGESEKQDLEGMAKMKYGNVKSKKQLNEIFKCSYGHFELYKRLYKAEITGNANTLENYSRRLTKSFGSNSLKIFRKLINKVDLSKDETEFIRIYRELGFIKDGDIVIPVLRKYILDLTPKEEILFDKDDGQIIFKNIEQFTKTELQIVKAFLENENEVVSKEELGDLTWGDKVNEKYSPWAIDQIIFRLRMKLDKLNLNGEIKTIHGKGYVFRRD